VVGGVPLRTKIKRYQYISILFGLYLHPLITLRTPDEVGGPLIFTLSWLPGSALATVYK
jgi:hypothetical protein